MIEAVTIKQQDISDLPRPDSLVLEILPIELISPKPNTSSHKEKPLPILNRSVFWSILSIFEGELSDEQRTNLETDDPDWGELEFIMKTGFRESVAIAIDGLADPLCPKLTSVGGSASVLVTRKHLLSEERQEKLRGDIVKAITQCKIINRQYGQAIKEGNFALHHYPSINAPMVVINGCRELYNPHQEIGATAVTTWRDKLYQTCLKKGAQLTLSTIIDKLEPKIDSMNNQSLSDLRKNAQTCRDLIDAYGLARQEGKLEFYKTKVVIQEPITEAAEDVPTAA